MIHKYKQLGLNIVMDVYSGAVHVVDDVMYDMLDYTLEPFMAEAKCPDYIKEGLKDKYSEEELEESYAEICALVNAGQLFTDDCYDEIAKNWNKQSVVKALCIHVAHDCNLRCKYCFADTGEFHGGRSLMSAEVGKKAIDFVINNSGNRKNIEIDYFGGEPLMNFGVVKEITEYAKEEAKNYILSELVPIYRQMQFFTTEKQYTILISKKGKITIKGKNKKSEKPLVFHITAKRNIFCRKRNQFLF